MRITHVKIQNILGIQDLELKPGGFTSIKGRNGSGKSSVLEAIKAVIQGGHDATLLRNGAEKGEVVLVLDDGTEIRKRVGKASSTTDVIKAGKKVARPGDAIKALTDAISVNPISFLTADAKDRVKVLLQSMPLEVDTARLSEMAGIALEPQPGIHALHVIDQVRSQVYSDRTGTNRAVTEKEGTIRQLRQAIPPAQTEHQNDDEASLQTKLDEADEALSVEKARIDTKLGTLRTANANDIIAIREQITLLQGQITGLQQSLVDTESKANIQRHKAATKHAEETNPIKMQLQAIRDNREAYARRQQTLETIGLYETELESLRIESETQTAALDKIDAYKLELLNSLPIPGLEVRGGELFFDNVPFDRLNTAKQVTVAVEIAKIRAGELGVICVDRIEALDPQTLAEFQQQALDSELQLFVTQVADGDMTIEYTD